MHTVAGGALLASTSNRAVAASDKLQIGFIGLGRQGTSRLNEFMRHPDVVAAAVCDLDKTHLAAAAAAVEKTQGQKPEQFHDFRKLLERKDLDAVMVATPDHWHALPAIQACRAGKDVFVEKPLAYSVGEGRAMVNAALKHKRITQMGNHIHNDRPTYRRVVEVIHARTLDETSVGPDAPTQYVIELNSGAADKLGLKKGDKIEIPAKYKKN